MSIHPSDSNKRTKKQFHPSISCWNNKFIGIIYRSITEGLLTRSMDDSKKTASPKTPLSMSDNDSGKLYPQSFRHNLQTSPYQSLSSSSTIVSCLSNLRKEPQEACDFLSFLNWVNFISFLSLMTFPPLSSWEGMYQFRGNNYTVAGPDKSQDKRIQKAVVESWMSC